jgi:hypothetical protein
MSVNLGSAAYEAVTNLKNSSDWRQFVNALDEQVQNFMHKALEVPVSDRPDATGYARALRDLLAHIAQIESPLPGGRVPRPPVKTPPAR